MTSSHAAASQPGMKEVSVTQGRNLEEGADDAEAMEDAPHGLLSWLSYAPRTACPGMAPPTMGLGPSPSFTN